MGQDKVAFCMLAVRVSVQYRGEQILWVGPYFWGDLVPGEQIL